MRTFSHHVREDGDSSAQLLDVVAANRRGEGVGIYSICSANRTVLEASMLQACRDGAVVLIESTCNQVNQFGGYTGMTPADFRTMVHDVARRMGLPVGRVLLGGDHLGPYPWSGEPVAGAMAKARDLVRDCVVAGYTKIHLDASAGCADDPEEGPDELAIATREAQLCRAAEEAWARLPRGTPRPVYVVGTEVPAPGGEQQSQVDLGATRVDKVERTLMLAHEAFARAGVGAAWDRVIALVVQPGVEFGDGTVFDYERAGASGLSSYIAGSRWQLVYEAHSTDYQTQQALQELVEDHFAILKVGPWATFALREGLFALEAIEHELLAGRLDVQPSLLRGTLETVMLAHPEHWRHYYHGTEETERLARAFSFSDRARYYWPRPELQGAVARLLHNLGERPLPLTLLSQYLPGEYDAVRAGELAAVPRDLLRHRVLAVFDRYAVACGM